MSDVVIIVHVVQAAEAGTSKRVAKNSWPEAVVVVVPKVMIFGVAHSLTHPLRIRTAEDHELFVISVGHHTVHTRQMSNKVPQSVLAFFAAPDFNYLHTIDRSEGQIARCFQKQFQVLVLAMAACSPSFNN
jgi:hypothetical protein